jgi:LysR family glycine cleavage system transcriptional activator
MPKFRLPPLNSLVAFEAAARHQSIQRACDELHVNHAAVSRHIKNLERNLACALFERRHRKVILTNDGTLLLNALTIGFSHIQRTLIQMRKSPNMERLVISVDPDFAGLWLVPRLADFLLVVPDVLVEIIAAKASLSLQDVRVSCAIQYAEVGKASESAEMLFRSRLFPVCAKCLLRSAPLRSLDDLRHHKLLHDRSITEWEEYLRSSAVTIDINAKSGPIFSDTSHCLDAAARGQGVAIGDDFLAATHLSEGRLVKPFGSPVLSKNAYYFVAPDRTVRHPAVNAFRLWLLRSIERQRASSRVHRSGRWPRIGSRGSA